MKNQKGYVIQIVLIVFAVIIGLMIFPIKFPKPTPSECTVGEPGDGSELKDLPAIKNMTDAPRLGQPSDLSIGGPDPDEKTDFVQIRKNVPTSKKSTPANWIFMGGSTKSAVEHTINIGELSEKPGYDAYYPSEWGEMDLPGKGRKYIRGMGLLLFANNDPGTIVQKDDNTIYMVDVYQDKRVFDDKTKGYSEKDIFICGVDTEVGKTNVFSPSQSVSPDKKQLQLEWFLLTTDKVWGVHCKPAVYLYPEERKLVNVKVYPKGELSYTDPPYDPALGWSVFAQPNGNLSTMNYEPITNNYLYYESKLYDFEIKKPTKGWVVKFSGLENLLTQVLPKLGLNQKEKKDFMDYWLGKLPDFPYYFVGLVEKEQRDYLEALQVTPKPETSIRFSLYFEPLNVPKVVEEPQIRTPLRNGFTLVDWGGMIKLRPGTPFTCSQ